MANDSTVMNYLDENYITPEEFIELYKDSIIKDTLIIAIRKLEYGCMGHHGGSFDWFDCSAGLGKYFRKHRYGFDARLDEISFNEDRYFNDGKLIRYIKANYLLNEAKNPIEIKIHIYNVPTQ